MFIDGYPIDLNRLKFSELDYSNQACFVYLGILNGLSRGEHSYLWVSHFDREISDGWVTYPPGDYYLEFLIVVG